MARLNEPPIAPAPSAETLDAVKRRFLRQNRELAKTNSQQSIRIRTLENDASRLLAENLSLREQVLQLQNALEAQSNRPSFENIDSVKDRLEAKIQELGGLVAELGQLKKKDDGLPRCKSQLAATRRSPDERQWRSGLGLQDVENAMLPTIVEDKHYPRRTMNADELRGILDDPDSQSPDIGPPPVSRFESEEPIAFNPSPSEEQLGEQEDPEPALPITLETRRKRRESGPKLNIRRVSLFESPPEESEEGATKTVRTGAKRKFSVQEDEDKAKPQAEPFRFSRRNTPAPSENGSSNEEARSKSPERPVLGSKPVNTDPVVSPKKQRSSVSEKPDKKPLPKPGRSRLTITRNVRMELPPLEMPEPIPTAEIHLDSLPPKTPAAEDIFSPPSTEPSTSRPESKDTPPPGDLNPSDQSGLGGRPSRRARVQVSYKEPSLNTKMRRPGKELVDAVLPDHGRRTSVDPQTAPSTTGKIIIKQEHDSSSWNPMVASIVAGRRAEEDGELGSPLRQKLDRREGSQDAKSDHPTPKLNSSAVSNAISAMIEETSIAKRKTASSLANASSAAKPVPEHPPSSNKETKTPAVKQGNDDMAIFDFNESSPQSDNQPVPVPSSRPRIDLAKAARSARRHSSVPTSIAAATEERRPMASGKLDGAALSVHKRSGSASGVGATKSNSTTSLGKSAAAATRPAGTERKVVKGGVASGDLKAKLEGQGGIVAVNAAANAAANGSGSLRASRRKSMMI